MRNMVKRTPLCGWGAPLSAPVSSAPRYPGVAKIDLPSAFVSGLVIPIFWYANFPGGFWILLQAIRQPAPRCRPGALQCACRNGRWVSDLTLWKRHETSQSEQEQDAEAVVRHFVAVQAGAVQVRDDVLRSAVRRAAPLGSFCSFISGFLAAAATLATQPRLLHTVGLDQDGLRRCAMSPRHSYCHRYNLDNACARTALPMSAARLEHL